MTDASTGSAATHTPTALIGPVDPPSLHVMSFNIRRRILSVRPGSPDSWSLRRPQVRRILQQERPALLGVQEALPDQAETVHSALGDGYLMIGRGRGARGDGERCPVYLDGTRLELLDWRQEALSDTQEVAGSTSWGNWIPRILVRATVRDRATGAELLYINTHFDHLSRRSRMRSSARLRAVAAASGRPVVVTGDFNTDAATGPHRAAVQGGALRDAWTAADRRVSEGWGTFPHYREPRLGRKRIDWILVSPAIDVPRAGINTSREGGVWASDHTPVQAEIRLRP